MQPNFQTNREINGKKWIVALSVTSIICTIIGSIIWSPNVFGAIGIVSVLAAAMLIILYVLFLHKEQKASIILPISYTLIFLYDNIIFIVYSFDYFEVEGQIYHSLATLGLLLYITNTLILNSKKLITLISIILGSLVSVSDCLDCLLNISYYIRNDRTSVFLSFPITLTLFIALLILGLKNRTPTLFPQINKMLDTKLPPKIALKWLNDDLKQGFITEEEYQARRSEIIKNL